MRDRRESKAGARRAAAAALAAVFFNLETANVYEEEQQLLLGAREIHSNALQAAGLLANNVYVRCAQQLTPAAAGVQ